MTRLASICCPIGHCGPRRRGSVAGGNWRCVSPVWRWRWGVGKPYCSLWPHSAQARSAQELLAQGRHRQAAQWTGLQAQAEARTLQHRQRSAPLDWIARSVPPAEAGLQWQSVHWQPDRLTWVGLAASELLFNQWRLGLGEGSVVQRWEPVRWVSPESAGSHAAWLFEVRLTPAAP
jgi:hypothetical protein